MAARRDLPAWQQRLPAPARLNAVAILLLLVQVAIGLRLIDLHVLRADKFERRGGPRTTRERLPAERGDIRDRQGRILATCEQAYSVYADPQKVRDPVRTAELLADLLGQPADVIEGRLRNRWQSTELRRQVSAAAQSALGPLIERRIVSIREIPAPARFDLFFRPSQFAPSPEQVREIAIALGCQVAELTRIQGSTEELVPWPYALDQSTAVRLRGFEGEGLFVQISEGKPVEAVYLNPTPGAVVEVPRSAEVTPQRGRDWELQIVPEVWDQLAPLWQGGAAPAPSDVTRRMRRTFTYLAYDLPKETAEAVKSIVAANELQGVQVLPEQRRVRPHSKLADALLGQTDRFERGIDGLELTQDRMLTGVDGQRRITIDAKGRAIAQEGSQVVEPVHGKHVELTIDAVIQADVEEVLQAGVDANDANWGLAVVVDPHTGEILAMADAASSTRKVPNTHRSLHLAYEPGSVMKPLIVAHALEEGVADLRRWYECRGHVQVDKWPIRCIREHGPETISNAVRDSCNIVMVHLGLELGNKRLQEGLERFQLLKRTGADPGEAVGFVNVPRDQKRWSKAKVATVSFGKGVACTALGLARAYSMFANGGHLPDLRLVGRYVERDGRVAVPAQLGPGRPVISADSASQVAAMLREVVVHPKGTGGLAASRSYKVAGKTGTSLPYRRDGERIVSFAGIAPYPEARLVAVVSVAEPRVGLRAGSTTCGPIFRDIVDRVLPYLGEPQQIAGSDER